MMTETTDRINVCRARLAEGGWHWSDLAKMTEGLPFDELPTDIHDAIADGNYVVVFGDWTVARWIPGDHGEEGLVGVDRRKGKLYLDKDGNNGTLFEADEADFCPTCGVYNNDCECVCSVVFAEPFACDEPEEWVGDGINQDHSDWDIDQWLKIADDQLDKVLQKKYPIASIYLDPKSDWSSIMSADNISEYVDASGDVDAYQNAAVAADEKMVQNYPKLSNLYYRAESRLLGIEELTARERNFCLMEWPEGSEHLRWLITGEPQEIIRWVRPLVEETEKFERESEVSQ